MLEKILILDFGSQTTQLIGRRVRELGVYCEIVPYHNLSDDLTGIKGVILSGSPYSVNQPDAFRIDLDKIIGKVPVLGICYGAQFIANERGGRVEACATREFGRAHLDIIDKEDALLRGMTQGNQIWMSHGDTITALPVDAKVIAKTDSIPTAAYRLEGLPVWAVQFHPEVYHSEEGTKLLSNFLDICKCEKNWTPASFVESIVAQLKEQLGNDKVLLALSGGVDSSVCAVLLNKAIGDRLTCIFVDHGLLRKDEFENVLADYEHLGLNVKGVNAKEYFYSRLKGVTDPEQKRKIIGQGFIDVFEEEAKKIKDVKWLGQGTIYPDVIESLSITGTVIKSHHNVGGLPEKMNLKLVEPLRLLFKDEVRRVGFEMGMREHLIHRHPFPGPGLGIRILGEISEERVRILQEADAIYISALREWGLYDKVWQAGAILLPVQSVGVMGDERTYESVVALRAVTSTDAMSADWAHLPHEFLAKVSNDIINRVRGINRVVYDVSSKPPATIEWE
ncbi:glutamine-hydrolyzing GMP synthase [Porphyromonas cangingivalis]|uniref:GMP synthase [glutamine-hydrolyzing] n=1 Tax=Porphyromonas cangingivalis TaxID=36874 RepID=A0A1T4JY28_PORCN|nr:glutamine-hydrolyzing GMP synthase [Porphyromonas cangingivalis]SJZ35081.1 GMP synthase (glutamine-hydrolyzing) [Porphyromonas cangingivalis]VEJ03213.1 GMP synthase [glutamine-hydrolyzing] [Porphyromonas cangingivalis]